MKVLITGINGFIGKNLKIRLDELSEFETIGYSRNETYKDLEKKLIDADAVVHLAGENRPKSDIGFKESNIDLTDELCNLVQKLKKNIPLIFSSSTQASLDNEYGKSKLTSEKRVIDLSEHQKSYVFIYRLPGVFGKWCKPNYNSVVATFCNNIANGLPVKINDPDHMIKLVYIDDVISSFISNLRQYKSLDNHIHKPKINPEYTISINELYETICLFRDSRINLITERVGEGFVRALYSTYLTYLPKKSFSYPLKKNIDNRGIFVEMLKTHDSGQFSFFTAYPGITRGGHYHHSKNEKFLVLKGEAEFKFRHLISNEVYKLKTSDKDLLIVETIPGWVHDITNVGNNEMIVMLWANEIFDPNKPDTIASEI